MDSFHEYIKKQLVTYIQAEKKKGFKEEEVEKRLLDAGHHKNLIDEVMEELRKEESGKTVEKPKDEVSKDLVFDLKGSILNFFKKGRTDEEVLEAKEEVSGSKSEEIVEDAIAEAEALPVRYTLEIIVLLLYVFGLFVAAVYVSGNTGDDMLKILVGMSVCFVNAFVSLAFIKYAEKVYFFIWIPIIIAGAFYLIGTQSGTEIFKDMDVASLGLLNGVISLFFNVMLINIALFKPKPKILKNRNDEPGYDNKNLPARTDYQSKMHIDNLKREFNIH
jgi:hypothetical protein